MYYKIFSNCSFVDGVKFSAIYDLQREKIFTIPSDISEIIQRFDGKKIEELYKNKFSEIDKGNLDRYLDFFKKNDIIFCSKNKIDSELFPDIQFTFESEVDLNFVIISIFKNHELDLFSISLENLISDYKCKHVQLRFEEGITIEIVSKFLKIFKNSPVRHLSLVVNANDVFKINIENLLSNYPRIVSVVIYDYKSDILFLEKSEYENIEFIKYQFSDFPLLKKLNNLRFLAFDPNIPKYSEAQSYNLYHNKKVYIESDGTIYNSIFSMKKFGNLLDDNIEGIIKNKEFQKYWGIGKDKIKICQDCMYRYTCVDGRIPILNVEGEYFINETCNYNPYTNEFKK